MEDHVMETRESLLRIEEHLKNQDTKLDIQQGKIAEIATALATHIATVTESSKSQDKEIGEIKYAVYGNGTPGLKTQMDRNTQFIARLKVGLGLLFTAIIAPIVVYVVVHLPFLHLALPS